MLCVGCASLHERGVRLSFVGKEVCLSFVKKEVCLSLLKRRWSLRDMGGGLSVVGGDLSRLQEVVTPCYRRWSLHAREVLLFFIC